nr:DeoR/GlpR family DNA-binding transcription regulator [Spiroplasma alleghenense]
MNERGYVKNNEMAILVDATIPTIIGDINHLESEKLVIKVYGGAKSINSTGFNEYSDEEKVHLNSSQKELIAKTAAELVQNGELIFIDTGTTTNKMLKHLVNKQITIVTNGYSNAKDLIELGIKFYIVGGEIRPQTRAIVGSLATDFIDNFSFDKAFIGANGVVDEKIYTTHVEEAIFKKKIIKCSHETFVLADSSKINKSAPILIDNLDKTTLITDGTPLDGVKKIIHV